VGERFGRIGEWASAITESVMDGRPGVGRVRTCQVAGFGPIAAGVIQERLVDFDPEARSLSYEAAGDAGINRARRQPLVSARGARHCVHGPDSCDPDVAPGCPPAGAGAALADARGYAASAGRVSAPGRDRPSAPG